MAPSASVDIPPIRVEKQFFTDDSPLTLESGKTLHPLTLAYETYGQPNADRSNAILILHALSGDSHAAGVYTDQDKKPGWWDDLIGPGKAFDTKQYWVICSNIIGGCMGSTGPNSPNPQTGKPYSLDFPMITIGDMVQAQHRLMTHLGVESWYAVAGGSIGGFQLLEWVLRYPHQVQRAICMASGPKLSAQGIAFNAVGRHAITTDPNWHGGDYYDSTDVILGLATARMMAHITYLSEESLNHKFGRRLQDGGDSFRYDFATEFAVESYLEHQGKTFIDRFDANSYLYITRAMDYFDVSTQYGPLAQAFQTVQARFLVLSFSSDWLFPPSESRRIVSALVQNNKDVSYVDIETPFGHDAFLLEVAQMTRAVRSFLSPTAEGCCHA